MIRRIQKEQHHLPPKLCASCTAEIKDGDICVRIQYGKLNISNHYQVHREAKTDDYFCEQCQKEGNIAIRQKV